MSDCTVKNCSKCREAKPRNQFSPDRKNKDGLYCQCKQCKSEYRKANYVPAKKRSRAERFWLRVDKSGGDDACWLWTAGTNSGYGTIKINNKAIKAHRLSYEINIGPIPGDFLVCHSCDNPQCVNPKHLFLGTVKDNNDDKMQKGRHKAVKGEVHPGHKLTESDVREIRRLWDTKQFTQIAIGVMIGVSNITVSDIVRGKSWKHI